MQHCSALPFPEAQVLGLWEALAQIDLSPTLKDSAWVCPMPSRWPPALPPKTALLLPWFSILSHCPLQGMHVTGVTGWNFKKIGVIFLQVLTWNMIQMHNRWLFSHFPSMLWFCSRPAKGILYAHWTDNRHTLLCMLAYTSGACLKRQSQWKRGHPLFSALGRKWHSTSKRSLFTPGDCFWFQQQHVKFCQDSQLPDGTRTQTEDWSLMNPARARISVTVQNKLSEHLGQLRAWTGLKL